MFVLPRKINRLFLICVLVNDAGICWPSVWLNTAFRPLNGPSSILTLLPGCGKSFALAPVDIASSRSLICTIRASGTLMGSVPKPTILLTPRLERMLV